MGTRKWGVNKVLWGSRDPPAGGHKHTPVGGGSNTEQAEGKSVWLGDDDTDRHSHEKIDGRYLIENRSRIGPSTNYGFIIYTQVRMTLYTYEYVV